MYISNSNLRHYFAISTNSGEQAHSFMTLGAWLIQQAGGHFDKPQEVFNLKKCYPLLGT